MLQMLTLNNLAIIDEGTMEFGDGVTVLGGESGSGKSLFFKAIDLIMGSDDIQPFVRNDNKNSELKAVFTLSSDKQTIISDILQDNLDEPIPISEKICIQRFIQPDATTTAWIDGTMVSTEILQKVADHLVIYSRQHQHLALDRSEYCFELVDRYGRHDRIPCLEKYDIIIALRRQIQELEAEVVSLSQKIQSHEENIEFLNELAPIAGQYEACKEKALREEFFSERLKILLIQYYKLFGSGMVDSARYRRLIVEKSPKQFRDQYGVIRVPQYAQQYIREAVEMDLPQSAEVQYSKSIRRLATNYQKRLEHVRDHFENIQDAMWKEIEYLAGQLSSLSNAQQEYEQATEACERFDYLVSQEEYNQANEQHLQQQEQRYQADQKRYEKNLALIERKKAAYEAELEKLQKAKKKAQTAAQAAQEKAQAAQTRAQELCEQANQANETLQKAETYQQSATTAKDKQAAQLTYQQAQQAAQFATQSANKAATTAQTLAQEAKKAAQAAAQIQPIQRTFVLPQQPQFAPTNLDRNVTVWEKIIAYPHIVAEIQQQKMQLEEQIQDLRQKMQEETAQARNLACHLMHTRENTTLNLVEGVQEMLRTSLEIPNARVSIVLTPSHSLEEALDCQGTYKRSEEQFVILPPGDSTEGEDQGIAEEYEKITFYLDENCDMGFEMHFYFSANPDEPKRKISNVASGGELSRLNFAVQYELAKKVKIATFIMDEIDAGISGTVAIRLAERVREMSREGSQILMITHTAAVAAIADHHYQISKSVNEQEETQVCVRLLNLQQRIQDLAHIMSGNTSTNAIRLSLQLLGLPNETVLEEIPAHIKNIAEWQNWNKDKTKNGKSKK